MVNADQVNPKRLNAKERFYEAIMNAEEPDRSGIHVTDLVKDCMRQVYYTKTYGQTIDGKLALIFAVGKAVHLISILKEHEKPVQAFGVVGSIDDYEDGIVIDKKTCRDLNTDYLIKPQYKRQLEYYKLMLLEMGEEFKAAKLLYIDLVTHKLIEVDVPTRHVSVIKKEFLKKKDALAYALIKKKVPERTVGSQCNYCPHFQRCFKK